MLDYINEAFRSLEMLNEDIFDTDYEGLTNLSTFIDNNDDEETIKVIDPEAATDDDINTAYVGKVIIDCKVCHSHIFKNKEDIVLTDEGEVNLEEQCPYCGEEEGFVIVGEISKYPNNENDSAEDPVSVDDISSQEEQPVQEAYTRNDRKFISRKSIIEKKHSDVNKEIKIPSPYNKYFELIDPKEIDFEEGMYNIGDKVNDVTILAYLAAKDEYSEQFDSDAFLIDDPSMPVVEIAHDRIYPVDIAQFEKNLTESVNNVNVETDDSIVNVATEEGGKVTVTTEPKNEANTEEDMITPVSDETVDAIISANDESAEEPNDMSEVEFDIDEVDEESIDELGESYLKRVYENVDSFRTSCVSTKDSRIIIEGLIKFKSGAEKKTGFIFEAKTATKTGKVKFIGENKHLCRGNKAFTLTGKMSGSKLIAESFTYNYRAKNAEGKPTKVYGTVRSSRP